MTLAELKHYCKADILRRLQLEGRSISFLSVLSCMVSRGTLSVLIYRVKRYLYFKHAKPAKILIYLLRAIEFHICHNELDPRADIGEGLVLSDLGGIGLSFSVIIGKNCTFMGKSTPTLGAIENVDMDSERITIGNYCVIGHNVKIINSVTVADGVQLKPNSVLMKSVLNIGAIVSGFPAKEVGRVPALLIDCWNPIQSKIMEGPKTLQESYI
jgi:serine acetyltransferase